MSAARPVGATGRPAALAGPGGPRQPGEPGARPTTRSRPASRASHPLAGLLRTVALGARTSWLALALAVIVSTTLVAAVAVSIKELYPTLPERVAYAASAGRSVPAAAFNGRGYDLTTLGGITAVEVGFIGQILFPATGVVLAVRLTRREEESGRTELLTASRVGRLAPLAAAAGLLALTALLTAVTMTAGMVAVGLPASGSAWYAAAAGACMLFFATVGLLLAQLCQQARSAQQLGAVVVSAAFLARFVVDGLQADATWLSPLGWLPEVRAFGTPRAWPLAAYGAASLCLLLACTVAASRRDAGAGVLTPRSGPARGGGRACAWRLALRAERAATTTCLALACLWALLIGSFSTEMTTIINDNPSLLAAMGLERSTDLMVMMASVIMAAAAGAVAVQGAVRLGVEESEGRLGLLASTRLSRGRLWAGWWATTLLSAATVLVLSALVLGVSTWAASGQRESLRAALEVGGYYLAPVVLMTAVCALATATGPRWPALGWALVAWTVTTGFLAEELRLPEWARDLSPVHMVGVLPVDDPDPWVVTGQLAAAAVLLACSLLLFRHRDLRAG